MKTITPLNGPGFQKAVKIGWKSSNTNGFIDMSDEPEDKNLVENFLRSRDEVVFRMLYRRHTPRLYLFVLRLCGGDEAAAEDVVQETWIRAVQNLSRFLWKSAFSSWLCGIAFNCYREQRAVQRSSHPADIEDAVAKTNIDSALDLETLIRRLPDRCREVFVMHDIEGYSHDEIGNLMNIGNGTSKSQLFEARKKLRLWLTSTREDQNDNQS